MLKQDLVLSNSKRIQHDTLAITEIQIEGKEKTDQVDKIVSLR